MNILDDNTIIPSYLSVRNRGSTPSSVASLNDFTLRFGEIKKLIYPNETASYSKKTLEYEVEVQYREGSGVYSTSIYRGVAANTVFGGIADRFNVTYRPDEQQTNPNTDIGVGSKVLLLCINGDQQKAIIIGGLNDPQNPQKPTKEEGHNLYFEFNGVKFQINKDGEATLTFRGATKSDGSLTDNAIKEAEGTKLSINKQGNLTIATPDEAQFLRLNHQDKKIELQADSEWNSIVNGEMNIEVNNDVNIQSNESKMNLAASSNITMKSAGVLVGDATDAWVKGTTYRNSEIAMHQSMTSALILLNAAAATLATAGATISTFSSFMVIPVAGAIIASPGLAASGAGISNSAALISSASNMLISAIATFESGSYTYLSPKNKTD